MYTIGVNCYNVNGHMENVDFELEELLESILPGRRPEISTIVLDAVDANGKKLLVCIGPSGVIVRDSIYQPADEMLHYF